MSGILLLSGVAFVLIAALGVLRMPDLLMRMHAATKAGTLGIGLILAAVGVHFGDAEIAIRAAVAAIFLVLTAPVAAHVIGRTGYRTSVRLWERTLVDELRDQSRAAHRADPSTTPPRDD